MEQEINVIGPLFGVPYINNHTRVNTLAGKLLQSVCAIRLITPNACCSSLC